MRVLFLLLIVVATCKNAFKLCYNCFEYFLNLIKASQPYGEKNQSTDFHKKRVFNKENPKQSITYSLKQLVIIVSGVLKYSQVMPILTVHGSQKRLTVK